MLNWIKFLAVFLLSLAVAIAIIVFYNAHTPFASAEQKSTDAAVAAGKLKTVDSAEVYNGTIGMVTVYGTDEKGNDKAVFIEKETEKVLGEIFLKDGVKRETAIATVKKELKVDKLLHARLGMEEGHPIWEVAFKSDNGKLNYVYIFFENGQWWKRILNL